MYIVSRMCPYTYVYSVPYVSLCVFMCILTCIAMSVLICVRVLVCMQMGWTPFLTVECVLLQ